MGRLEGKVAIITGIGHGLGKAGALLFAREGAKIVGCNLNAETGQATIREIKEAGGEGTYIRCDVSKSDDVKAMVDLAVRTYGKIDILYNNAGRGFGGPVTELKEEDWDRAMDTNLKSVYLTCKYAIPEMIKQPSSAIINTSSIAGLAARTLLAAELHAYAATKGGINSLSMWLAAKYGPKGVRVNVIAPGNMGAGMGERLRENYPKPLMDQTPLKIIGDGNDIAYAALFLASDESKFITGVVLPVDGGFVVTHGLTHEG